MAPRTLVTLLASSAIVFAGCGSSNDSSSSSSSSSDTSSSGSSASQSGGAKTVKAAGFAFAPKEITVKKGDKVTWTNSDPAPHNVTSDDGTLKSPNFSKGASFTYTATKAGTFNYVCTIHPQMKATLIVTG